MLFNLSYLDSHEIIFCLIKKTVWMNYLLWIISANKSFREKNINVSGMILEIILVSQGFTCINILVSISITQEKLAKFVTVILIL